MFTSTVTVVAVMPCTALPYVFTNMLVFFFQQKNNKNKHGTATNYSISEFNRFNRDLERYL
jgi:hypothetical protein